jgi:anti-sigma factor RsiW
MNCCEFRENHSDFADGLLPSQEEAEASAHLAACAACRRFDAVLRAGLDVLRALPSVGVSRGFGQRLRERLRDELAVRMPGVAGWSGVVGTLLMVATVGVIGWDLLESRAAHHGRVAWSATAWYPTAVPLTPADDNPAYANQSRTSADVRFVAYHPLNSILVTQATHPTASGEGLRFDLPAVWGGP